MGGNAPGTEQFIATSMSSFKQSENHNMTYQVALSGQADYAHRFGSIEYSLIVFENFRQYSFTTSEVFPFSSVWLKKPPFQQCGDKETDLLSRKILDIFVKAVCHG